jgi:hypothetical protein
MPRPSNAISGYGPAFSTNVRHAWRAIARCSGRRRKPLATKSFFGSRGPGTITARSPVCSDPAIFFHHVMMTCARQLGGEMPTGASGKNGCAPAPQHHVCIDIASCWHHGCMCDAWGGVHRWDNSRAQVFARPRTVELWRRGSHKLHLCSACMLQALQCGCYRRNSQHDALPLARRSCAWPMGPCTPQRVKGGCGRLCPCMVRSSRLSHPAVEPLCVTTNSRQVSSVASSVLMGAGLRKIMNVSNKGITHKRRRFQSCGTTAHAYWLLSAFFGILTPQDTGKVFTHLCHQFRRCMPEAHWILTAYHFSEPDHGVLHAFVLGTCDYLID